jgi:hypothetical protein
MLAVASSSRSSRATGDCILPSVACFQRVIEQLMFDMLNIKIDIEEVDEVE